MTNPTPAGAHRAPRADLLALSEDSLAAMANRGLVKRAARELGAGAGARISVLDDGALSAEFPDGTVTLLPAGSPLTNATCTCAAVGLCRHRIGLVLAYQSTHSAPSAQSGPALDQGSASTAAPRWSPGGITDETLERVLGARPVREARRALVAGYQATVHRPGPSFRNPRVELPTCTVVFHVPGDPAYATTDAVEQRHGEAVAMAVWAFRAADAQGLDGDSAQVNVGESADGRSPESSCAAAPGAPSRGRSSSRARAVETLLAHAQELVEGLLLDGVSTCGPLLVGNLRRSARDLAAASLLWPAAVLDALVEQLDWYLERNARHELARVADLATEFLGRRRAAATRAAADPASPALPALSALSAQILGTGESARTPLRRIRLIGLGCRVLGGPSHRTAELYFAHPHDGTVLVLRREWRFEETEQPPTGGQLRTRRVAGSPLHLLAVCNVVSEAASRSASRAVELGSSRVAKTTVTALGEAWRSLPGNVHIRDYAALAAELGDRRPRYLRPRVEAQDIYVLTVDEVEWVGYDPAAQCLEASVRDVHGTTARVRAPFRSTSPAALDALSAALGDGEAPTPTRTPARAAAMNHKPLMMISGRVTVRAGELVVDPIAVWGGGPGQPVVPDLATGDDSASLPAAMARESAQDGLALALRSAAGILAEHAHRGLDRLAPSGAQAVEQAAASLSRSGFRAIAALLADHADALTGEDRTARLRTWTDASIALAACLDTGS